jgi:hypothetical protein
MLLKRKDRFVFVGELQLFWQFLHPEVNIVVWIREQLELKIDLSLLR